MLLVPQKGRKNGSCRNASTRVEPDIDVDCLVRQPPHADPVHARLRDGPDRLEAHPPRSLQQYAAARGVPHLDRLTQLVRPHVVEQHKVNPTLWQRQQRPKLLQVVHLDLEKFDLHALAPQLFGPLDRSPHALSHLRGSHPGNVVVLDQDSVVQPQSVTVAPSAAHGVLLENSQARGRLACVQELGLAVLSGLCRDSLQEGAGACGNATQATNGVENGALQRQHLFRGTRDCNQSIPFVDVIPILCLEDALDVRREDPDSFWHHGQPRHHQISPRPEQRLCGLGRLHHHLARQVPYVPPGAQVLIASQLQEARYQP
mmetsp:Transcript_27512/g.69780  ORF Transcript_27512/g.69780 Transcript_27512/m.69780 type:complete len:316 (-) Transcript_27512:174-1121(-)